MFIKVFAIALPIFVALDLTWVGLLAKGFYRSQVGYLMRSDVNWIPAIAFYLLFVAGLVVFVISPALEKGSWTHALIFGAFFGLVTYATYDLTNFALTKDWPLLVTIVDLAWGAFIAAAVSTITFFIAG